MYITEPVSHVSPSKDKSHDLKGGDSNLIPLFAVSVWSLDMIDGIIYFTRYPFVTFITLITNYSLFE